MAETNDGFWAEFGREFNRRRRARFDNAQRRADENRAYAQAARLENQRIRAERQRARLARRERAEKARQERQMIHAENQTGLKVTKVLTGGIVNVANSSAMTAFAANYGGGALSGLASNIGGGHHRQRHGPNGRGNSFNIGFDKTGVHGDVTYNGFNLGGGYKRPAIKQERIPEQSYGRPLAQQARHNSYGRH